MIELEEAVKYFNDCKPKYLRRFSEKTPEGNCIKGWICGKPNRYLGSLLIDEVNNFPHNQFVQSMPKIEYLNDERDICLDKGDAIAYEKLDGTCLILYPLLSKDGFIMEVIPKTRGRAVADKNFLDLYNKIDKTNIAKYYSNNKGILYFEMYGILNQHEIIHYDTAIDIALIGCYDNGEFLKPKDLWWISAMHLFKQPDEVFRIVNNRIIITSLKYRLYFEDIPAEEKSAPTVIDAVDKIQHFMEWLNKKYETFNGRIASEGVVVNCSNISGRQKYIKIKPRDIENKHRAEGGIPRSSITKEVLKYFDEYGSGVEEIYQKDKTHHTEYIHRMLCEDYPEEFVKNSAKRIEKVFMQIWDSKQIPESIHKIGQGLFDEYGDKGITQCMRMFAQKYPMKKQYSRTVYQVLEKIFVKNGVDLNGR